MNNKRLKAEWEKQEAIIIAFPNKKTDWKDNLKEISIFFIKITNIISETQKVYIICLNINIVKNYFSKNKNIFFYEIPFNDTWIRDYGFITIEENNKKKYLNFIFNAWGNKYNSSLDNSFNRNFYNLNILDKYIYLEDINFILEAGSIDTNGKGVILTTSRCLCNKNRNGKLSKKEIESKFQEYFGTKSILWINNGYLDGDDTDGHIDMLARFISVDTILYLKCYNKKDKHFNSLNKMEKELQNFFSSNINKYKLIPIPLPSPIYSKKDINKRLPASYINFLIINKTLIYPKYSILEDKIADKIFKNNFKNRKVIGVDSRFLIEEGGSLHCSTIQI